MKKLLITAILSTFAWLSPVQADTGTDVGAMFGVKNGMFDGDTSGTDYNAETGLMGGVLAYGRFGEFSYRTGGYYSERKTEVKVGTATSDFKVAALDVPVTMMYSFSDVFSLFGGALLSLKLSDSCTGNTLICEAADDNVKSFMTSATVGISSKFHPNWTGEVFYEYGLSDVADDLSVNAISAALVFIY